MKKFLTSPLGSVVKVFVSTVLTMWIAMDDLWAMDIHTLKSLATAGVVSCVPMVINYLNPNYTQYGTKSGSQTEGE